MTVEIDFYRPFMMNALKFWHLFNNRDVLKYRLFANDQIKSFNILTSEDGVTWNMIVSESNYFMNDKKYYYKAFSPIKTKYVRLNILIDDPRIVIPSLEVFGGDELKER